MTNFIQLEATIYDVETQHTKSSSVLDQTTISYWANQVPEHGDKIKLWSEDLYKVVTLVVRSRTWNLTARTGPRQGQHDVYVEASGWAQYSDGGDDE